MEPQTPDVPTIASISSGQVISRKLRDNDQPPEPSGKYNPQSGPKKQIFPELLGR